MTHYDTPVFANDKRQRRYEQDVQRRREDNIKNKRQALADGGRGYLVNGSGTRKIRRVATAPHALGGKRDYYDSSKYMPHTGNKQLEKAERRHRLTAAT